MENDQKRYRQSASKKLLIVKILSFIAKILGVAGGSFYLLIIVYMIKNPNPLIYHDNNPSPDFNLEAILSGVFSFLLILLFGFAGISGGFLTTKRPILATWLLFSSGLFIVFTAEGVYTRTPFVVEGILFAGTLLIIGGLMMLSLYILPTVKNIFSTSNKKYEEELAQLKNMVEAGNYSEAMPRVFKLARVNPDNPEVVSVR